MDDEKLTAMRAAAAARGARGIERTTVTRLEAMLRAGSLRRGDRSDRSTRSLETVPRKGGRPGTPRKIDAESE